MLASPTFNGLRLSLSESSRLQYGSKPDTWAEYIQHVFLKNDKVDIDATLTPGLNVVIGSSSSGKTLFIDSLYRKIAGDFSKCSYDNYGIQDIQVRNPSGQRPHYFFQNYIIEICKEKENKIDSIPILRSIFPEDKDERQKIENGLSELKSKLDALVESVERIETLQEELLPLPHLSRLIFTEAIPDNPLKYILPTQTTIESIRYSKAEYDRELGYLNTIDSRLEKNPLIHHDKQLVEKLKVELALAFSYSETETAVRDIITDIKAEIDSQQAMEKREATTKRQQFDNLLECIANYFKFHRQFYESLNAISEFSISSPTRKIESMGHTLFVDNEFELTKGKFLEVVNNMLTKPNEIGAFENIRPEALFKNKFKRKPDISNYGTFKNKVASAFADMNRKKYKILTKGGKDFETLSAGWKTAIILDLILGSVSDNAPLIIDQPEDNLATNYINSGLLKAIMECKTRKQIILVSHNATIPMLGDAQNIILCRNDGNNITIRSNPLEGKIGNIDVVDLIAEITDGGKISVKKRVKKYNLKKFRSSHETSIQEG